MGRPTRYAPIARCARPISATRPRSAAAQGPAMLSARGLTAGYRSVDVIAGLDLDIARGESVGLIGPNGAGKSTLMAALTGTIGRRGGQARFEERDLIRMP